jgi:hypothetical protein
VCAQLNWACVTAGSNNPRAANSNSTVLQIRHYTMLWPACDVCQAGRRPVSTHLPLDARFRCYAKETPPSWNASQSQAHWARATPRAQNTDKNRQLHQHHQSLSLTWGAPLSGPAYGCRCSVWGPA